MIIPFSFYALVYYRFRCIVERPKIRLNDQSENGLMYLAISLRFYVLAAKIRFSFVTSKKLTRKNSLIL